MYTPKPQPGNPRELSRHVFDELQQQARAGGDTVDFTQYNPLARALKKTRAGTVVYADGVNLDLGSGEGLYRRNVANTAWSIVGIGTSTGTVTQLTSKATGVTLNKSTGQITTHNAALAAATTVTFTLTNSVIAAVDVVLPILVSGHATAGTYQVWCEVPAAGSVKFNVRNMSAGSLSEALVIQFVTVKPT